MKHYLILGLASIVLVLAGCTQPIAPDDTTDNSLELANPAARFCIEQGGTLALSGSTGYCTLPNGDQYEEWEFYRSNHINTDTDAYIWLSLERAEAEAAKRGVPFRVIEIDGESLPRHDDLRFGRVNAIVQDHIVTDVIIEDEDTVI